MPECEHCGHHITTDFVRVFSDNEGRVNGCPHCKDRSLKAGGYKPTARADGGQR